MNERRVTPALLKAFKGAGQTIEKLKSKTKLVNQGESKPQITKREPERLVVLNGKVLGKSADLDEEFYDWLKSDPDCYVYEYFPDEQESDD